MVAILKVLAILGGVGGDISRPEYTDICTRDWSEKSLEAKIELSVGCSEISGRRVYFNSKLEGIYNGK